MAIISQSLLDIHEELNRALKDLAFFGSRYQAILEERSFSFFREGEISSAPPERIQKR